MPKGGAGRGQGRKRYEPSISDRNTVKAMIAVGIPQERIAHCVGEYGIDEKTLRKYFRRELDTSKDLMVASVGQVVIAAAQRGESWACQLVMKCRGGWHETSALAVSGPDGGPIDVRDVSSAEILAGRIAGLASRIGPQSNSG